MRRRPELAGYVITELTDCNWESNGLLDLKRNPRVFHDVFRTINADTVIVPVWERLTFWDDEKLSLRVAVANGPHALVRGTLNVSVGGAHLSQTCSAGSGAVIEMPTMELALPSLENGQVITIGLELRGADETLIASNS